MLCDAGPGPREGRGQVASRAKPTLAVLAYCKGPWVRAREPVIWDQESLAYDGATGGFLQPGRPERRQIAFADSGRGEKMVVTGLPSVKSQ
jgi:hypothetical protein